jgi:hypothetical protein
MAQRILQCVQLLALLSIAFLAQSDSSPRFEVAFVKPLPIGSGVVFDLDAANIDIQFTGRIKASLPAPNHPSMKYGE